MTKNLFKPFLWGILALSTLSSCRTDSVATEQTAQVKEKIAAFERFETENNIIKPIASSDQSTSSAKYVSYAYPFAQIIYNFLQNHPDYAKKVANESGTIRLDVVSQTFGDAKKAVIFPVTDNEGRVVGIWVGVINEERDYVNFYSFNQNTQGVSSIINSFQNFYNQKEKKVAKGAIASIKGLNPIAKGQEPPKDPPVKTIEEVVITVPAPERDIVIPSGPTSVNYGNTLGGGMSGGSTTHGGGGGGGSSSMSASQWAKEHIDASALKNNKCADEVYQKLKDNSAFFNNLLGKFEGNSILDLKFEIKDLKVPAKTEIENVRNGYVTIAFNPNYLGSSELGRASLFIHEMLHAYMTWQLKQAGWDGLDNAISYKSIDEKNLPDLLKAYKEKNYERPGASEHEFISNFYIPKIVNALKAYDPNLGTDSEYEKIAWAGLQETDSYKNKSNKDTYDSIIWDNIKKIPCGN
ncbi:hypothetical protein HZQ23_16080 [Elizabethkingia anophelis]|uniref:hypothetical protein n=1 Tax=Elizabethkingia anophelis TaxID=1117645 RepID=UPI0020B29CA2|nr:hypothetical protein [Elizabethkingia anophelis]MCT3992570.1 hypothetical protein [Elizabethkingia anophelis]MCT4010427.1 hypothetical protein [Elizabethkingia anophelis]MDV4142686.1 hypothetical protein [Elizabethkingia anophelis]UTF97942.1 hypothetical protein J2N94_06660 [Elizabethkingia anophelis]